MVFGRGAQSGAEMLCERCTTKNEMFLENLQNMHRKRQFVPENGYESTKYDILLAMGDAPVSLLIDPD